MASFSFKTSLEGERAVIRSRGYLSRNGGEVLEQEVVRLVELGFRSFLVDFRDMDLINSVGVSILIGVIEQVRAHRGEIAFSDLSPVNEEIFRIMGLHRYAQLVPAGGEPADGA